jgi:2C-methyl-D-erythritol 2,4-cyclodiphosphate synthase
MTEEDLKAVLAKYQQKAFELYNTNIVLETQVEQLNKTVTALQEQLKKPKRTSTKEGDFQ